MKTDKNLIDRELTGLVIGGFYASYNGLGFGFNENVYGNALQLELGKRGLLVSARYRRKSSISVNQSPYFESTC